MKSKSLKRRTKRYLYETIIVPEIFYTSTPEGWTLSKAHEALVGGSGESKEHDKLMASGEGVIIRNHIV
jgi:hypothetical protein